MTSPDFAAAQARIAERNRIRQARLQSQQQLREQAITSTSLSRLPAPLRQLCVSAWSQWDQIASRQGTGPAFRVGQVDAELLDEELLELLKGQVEEAVRYYGQHIRNDWHAEIQLVLRTVLFKLTIWDHDASYGASLQNLKYTDARGVAPGQNPTPVKIWQKALYGIISVGGRYGWGRWTDYLLDLEGGYDEPSRRVQLLSRLSTLASTTHSFAAFASFLVFLVNGYYRTLLDRILRMRLTPTTSQVSREVSFEYLNRQLVWHAFTEFLLFLLPLVGISRWRRWIARAWQRAKRMFRSDQPGIDDEDRSGGELGFLPERTCAICYQDQNPTMSSENDVAAISAASSGIVGSSTTDITNPYETIPCGCIYCYVCIAQRLEAEDGEGWTCLRCGEIVKECKPWHGDVLVDDAEERKSSSSSSSKSTKRVTFADDEPHGEKSEFLDESFQTLDPIPLEDDDRIRAEISEDVARRRGSTLDESAEWSKVGVDVTPPPELENQENESANNFNDDDDLAAARRALSLSGFDAASALVTSPNHEGDDGGEE